MIKKILLFTSLGISTMQCRGNPDPSEGEATEQPATSALANGAGPFMDTFLASAQDSSTAISGSSTAIHAARMATQRTSSAVASENPAVLSRLSELVAQKSCQPRSREQLAALSLLMNLTPHAASLQAIECVIRSSALEDVVLWDALDAWIAIGSPASPVIADLKARALTFSTKRRFMAPQDVVRWIKETPADHQVTATILNGNGELP